MAAGPDRREAAGTVTKVASATLPVAPWLNRLRADLGSGGRISMTVIVAFPDSGLPGPLSAAFPQVGKTWH